MSLPIVDARPAPEGHALQEDVFRPPAFPRRDLAWVDERGGVEVDAAGEEA